MTDYPKFVEFHEEGPREGFQIEKTIYPIEERIELINLLSETGLKHIQVGSFVSPKYVPQMQDTGELFQRIRREKGVKYTALWLNEQGFRKAQSTPNVDIKTQLLFYASDSFSRKNNNLSAAEMRDKQREWVRLYKQEGRPVERAYVMAAFGCNFEGNIPQERVLDDFRFILDLAAEEDIPVPDLMLADTMGWGNPDSVKRMIGALRDLAPEARIGMHIHDTRGLGIANLHAALSMGVDLFDSSVAGLGGCPFADHGSSRAAGNVCTEDAVFLCHELGIETGINLDKLITAARRAETIIGAPLMGRVMHSGGLDKYR
ncbi:MAG: hydroxymethylglutaryl-CoA lyase [Sneathiella sp.]|jgi:hydroxymethylglutaryl-CoA lyase|uniref:hydroxymethylglutaryl-CoA lyase n=1 Tax=Sneathiella sp. TaxID=1964365 RepID=UPI000C55EEBE|nr:hydroxymethylglutaryl-CoA lyase [Sneathiella sp.]MAL77772.1 hydroxymethylglutaryl-CoA lyase [Sneathiella sp.]